jgi:hypothetical protein
MNQPKPLYQFNFANVPYPKEGDSSRTIRTSGCGIVSSVMAMNGCGVMVTVETMSQLSLENGFRASTGTSWGLFPWLAKRYDLEYQQTGDAEQAVKLLEDGYVLVASMTPGHFTNGGHLILLYGYKDGFILVNDPNSSVRTGDGFKVDIFKKECKQYFAFRKKVKVVENVHWAEAEYQKLKAMGIHIDEKRFDDKITRGEAMALIRKAIESVKGDKK